MAHKYDLEITEALIEETFHPSQHTYIKNYIANLIDAEDFSKFSRYTKNIVIQYMQSFINRLVCEFWVYYKDKSKTKKIEEIFKPLSQSLGKQLAEVKNQLLTKNIISDSMSNNAIGRSLEEFLIEYQKQVEFKKTQETYINLKQDFEEIKSLIVSLYDSGQDMVEQVQELMKLYLKNKEQVFQEMGFDVSLEYYSPSNFDFVYRDERLQDPKQRQEYEYQVIEQAIKRTIPGFIGTTYEFAELVKRSKESS